jgi:diguanylate cyclase (GGDEF)-like protein
MSHLPLDIGWERSSVYTVIAEAAHFSGRWLIQEPRPMQQSDSDGTPIFSTAADRFVLPVMKTIVATLGAAVLWCGLWLMLENASLRRDAAWHLCLPTLFLVMVSLMIYRENRKWWCPSRRLLETLEGCRAGERPIDELNQVGGAMAGVAVQVASLLHDLREQKRLAAELEAELRQRVANRTSALERQMSSLRAQATRDALTGLYNRRMLEECLPKMVQECRAAKGELSILAIDVDNFKPLNDSLGHATGDEFLRSIAQILRSGVRECDAAIRSGGDEFIILLPGCSLAAARSLADRLAAMVEGLAKTVKSPVPPGLSVGTASLAHLPPASPIESMAPALLEAADKQLYLKKAQRKRKVA